MDQHDLKRFRLSPPAKAKPKKPKDERTPERKAFDTFARKLARDVDALRASAESSATNWPIIQRLQKAADRAHRKFERLGLFDAYNQADEAAREELEKIRKSIYPAAEASGENYVKHLQSESARLSREIREANAGMGGYEKELALMRGRK